MESPLPFSLSLVLFLVISLVQPSFAILGAKSYDLSTNSLLTYQKFGFLAGGSITTSITLTQSTNSGALIYLLICNSDAKHSITSLAKNTNICQGQAISELMQLCMYKQVVFNDLDGVTRILPFDDPSFIQTLVGLDNSMGPTSSKDTAMRDTSEPTLLNMVKSKSSKQYRILEKAATMDNSEEDSASNEEDSSDSEVTVKTDPAVSSANNDKDYDYGYDDSDDEDQQEVLLRRVLNTWLYYEDFQQLGYVGLDTETIDELEEDYYLTPWDLIYYLTDTVSYEVVNPGMYYFLMLNCDSSARVNIDFALINPDSEHLSTGDIEYKALYCALIVCWALIFGFWVVTWIFNKYHKQRTYPLHYFFVVTGFCCFVLSIIEEVYWIKYSDSGYSPMTLRILMALLSGVANSLFLTLFLLIGKGYTYINLKMTVRDILDLVVFTVLRFVLSWMKEFFGKNVIIVICLVILYTFAFFLIRMDFQKSEKKIISLINSLQSPPTIRTTARTLSTRPSTTNFQVLTTTAPGPHVNEENDNVLDQAYIDGVTTPQENLPFPPSVNDASEQVREVVRSFDRDIKMLSKKLHIVKWLKLMILTDIILICIGEIVCVAAFMNKPFVLDLWTNFLFLVMFFVFTWFFKPFLAALPKQKILEISALYFCSALFSNFSQNFWGFFITEIEIDAESLSQMRISSTHEKSEKMKIIMKRKFQKERVNLKHKYAFIYSNIRNVQDVVDQNDLKTEGKTGSGYLDVADLYKISGNFVVIENAVDPEIRLASNMAKLSEDKTPPKLQTNNTEEVFKANLKAKLKKNAQEKKSQHHQQRVSKYKIPSTNQLSYPNLDLESPKIYIPIPNQKHINPHEISLHFENDSIKLDDLTIERAVEKLQYLFENHVLLTTTTTSPF